MQYWQELVRGQKADTQQSTERLSAAVGDDDIQIAAKVIADWCHFGIQSTGRASNFAMVLLVYGKIISAFLQPDWDVVSVTFTLTYVSQQHSCRKTIPTMKSNQLCR